MEFLVPLAAKSLLIAGATLLILKLMVRRSAADRSFVAHLGLAAIVLLPVALLMLPQLEVETSLVAAPEAVEAGTGVAAPLPVEKVTEVAPSDSPFPPATETAVASDADWAFWAYVAPAALLLLFTLIALARLVLLKAKSSVLVEPHWLTALARAQRRMGFKHGTALLTSEELRSPISWGLMRPVILLNKEAADAHGQAEAIIAHELAHVARLDWVKLLLSRVTVALFWFNPLVWLLAREAHQLREEAADDAVLGSDIEDTEYANLLVGIARHECRGLLLGAHGVAPARNSLARRVQRVLDVASSRAPGGWRWTAAAAFFAAGMAVPLAVLQFVPTKLAAAESIGGKRVADRSAGQIAATSEVSGAIAGAVGRAVTAAVGANTPLKSVAGPVHYEAPSGASITTVDGRTVFRSPSGQTITIDAPDANGRRRTVLRGPNGSVTAYADARAVPGLAGALAIAGSDPEDTIDRAIELKAVGATPDYVASLRRAAPHLRLDHDVVVEFAALGIDPAYLRDLASAGYARLDADDLVEAKAMGITGSYARAMSKVGYGRLSVDQLVELKAVGVAPEDVAHYRRSAGKLPSLENLVEMKALGVSPDDIEGLQLDPDPNPDP